MIPRRLRRAVTLGFEVLRSIVNFWLLRLRGSVSLEMRAMWAQESSRRALAGLGIECRVTGQPPLRGLVVANHLSYLDILVLSAAMPCFFVAKSEIGRWPVFGMAARICGTIFVDRTSRASAQPAAEEVTERLKLSIPIPVLLFPEGTSTDGSEVLRFHSRLIDPATSLGVPITTAAIRYETEDGTAERELCWYGDATFVDHIWKVLGVGGFKADVRFGEPRLYSDRRMAGDETRAEIVAMRERADSAIVA